MSNRKGEKAAAFATPKMGKSIQREGIISKLKPINLVIVATSKHLETEMAFPHYKYNAPPVYMRSRKIGNPRNN